MELTFSHDFDQPIDVIWSMLHDPDAHVAKFTRMGHTDLEVLDQTVTDTTLDLTIKRQVEIEVPSVAKKFISPSNTVTSVDHWERVDDDTCQGHYEVDIKGAPAETKGSTSVEATGTGCRYTVVLDVRVKVPMVGDRIAKALKPQLEKQMIEEFDAAEAWLAGER